MAGPNPKVDRHIDAAIAELEKAIASGDCGVCGSLIGAEVDNLRGIRSLTEKVAVIVNRQEATATELSEGNQKALARIKPQATTPRTPLGYSEGVADMAASMWRTRIRVVDLIPGNR